MNLIKNIKIDKKKIKEFSIVLTTLFLITSFLYIKFITGKYIFGSGDYLAPKMIAESVKNLQQLYGEYPYWMPSIFGGMPTIHSLQNISNYYMPNFILNILKIFSTPEIWTQLIHLIFAGLGVYVLLRFLKLDFMVALFGAIMFLMTPYMNVCIVHGHGSQIMTAAYIPWICWGLLKLWDKQNLQNLGILAIFVGFQLQRGHIQIAYYTWLMIGVFILYKIITSKFKPQFYYYLIASLFFGFLMSVSIIWPSYLYSEHSIRSAAEGGIGMEFEKATNWSFSFKEMITFIIPSFYGFGGDTYWGNITVLQDGIEYPHTDFPNYLGLFTLIFFIYGILSRTFKNNKYIYFLIVSTFFLLLSFGKNFFLFELLFNYLPFFNKFRAPMMALMMFQFLIIIVATIGLQSFLNILNDNKKIGLNYLIKITGSLLSLFIIFKFLIVRLMRVDDILKNMIHYDLNALIIILIIMLIFSQYLLYNTIKNNIILISIILLSTSNMYLINNKILDRPDLIIKNENIEFILKPLEELKEKYQNNKEKFRFISAEKKFHAGRNWSAYTNLESIDGYHPAKLKNYDKFEKYIRAYMIDESNKEHKNNENYESILEKYGIKNLTINILKLLNVKKKINLVEGEWKEDNVADPGVILDRIFFVDKLTNYKKDEELLMAMNNYQFDAKKLSYTKSSIPEFEKSNLNSKAIIKSWSPNKIIIETDLENENFIGLSEVYYPNWEITNHNIDIIQINGLLRGFVAPKGKNTIIMQFNSNDVKYAYLISLFSFVIMLICLLSTYLSTILKRKI